MAMWHFSVVDRHLHDPRWLEGVVQALREQRYTLISPMWLETVPDDVRKPLDAEIRAHYKPLPNTAWWGRR
jgi:hypothetical protein